MSAALKETLMSSFEVSFPSEIEIVMTRALNAPRALVYRLWSEPEHVRNWWGPAGFVNINVEMDFRIGGTFHIDMRAPDGVVYPCEGTYQDIVPDERIVYEGAPHIEHPCGAGLPPKATVFITFKDEPQRDGTVGTKLVLHSRMISAQQREDAIAGGFAGGWADSFERLAVELTQLPRFEIVTTHRLKATPAELFALFADPAHLKEWWGPEGFTSTIPAFEFVEGGAFRIIMHGPDGRDHDNHKRFVEIVANERIVFDHYQPSHQFRMTIEYQPHGDHTDMIWRMDFAPSEHEAMLKAFIPQANDQNCERLAVYHAQLKQQGDI
ncbi:SRPBCC family protein [Asticcacaulis endophyticus]|uniref:Activator of Hsp90 ATPase homologue 1/2-like C-terminal domain-containing protein n=1 Tax=Asticcacaulis endophyticus TaxID=1395890 RepID=A0A918PWK5_9CAUL|nr:SRPBCC family protein [Asticcacaulis endophyticus]GGZ23129.1 hypothetical protein GCM10011273_05070 [Asticcacaulis endophyticus]